MTSRAPRALLALLVATVGLAACGGDDDSADTTAAPATTAAAETTTAPATTGAVETTAATDTTAADTTVAETTIAATTTPAAPPDLGKAVMLVGSGSPGAALAPQVSLPVALGYWEEEGLDVTVQTGIQGDAQSIQLIASGQATTAPIAPTTLMQAQAEGLDIVGVYVYIRQPLNSIYVKEDSPITSIAELNGTTIGTYSPAGGPWDEGTFIIGENGGDPDSVEIVNIGFDQATTVQIQEDRVAAYIVTEPDFFTAQGLNLRKLPDVTEADRFGFVYVFQREYLEQHPDAVVAMMRGVAKATLFAVTNPAAAIKLHWEEYPASKPTGVDEATALEQAELSVSTRYAKYEVPDGEQWGLLPDLDAKWDVMSDLAVQAGIVETAPDPAVLFDASLIDQINDFDPAPIIEAANAG